MLGISGRGGSWRWTRGWDLVVGMRVEVVWMGCAWIGMFKGRKRVPGIGFAAWEFRIRQGLRAARRKTLGLNVCHVCIFKLL